MDVTDVALREAGLGCEPAGEHVSIYPLRVAAGNKAYAFSIGQPGQPLCNEEAKSIFVEGKQWQAVRGTEAVSSGA
jgi:hypothetical protein